MKSFFESYECQPLLAVKVAMLLVRIHLLPHLKIKKISYPDEKISHKVKEIVRVALIVLLKISTVYDTS